MAKRKSGHGGLGRAFDKADAMDGPLERKLDTYTHAVRQALPEVHAAYDRLVERIAPNGAAERAPAVGERLPDCVLTDTEGSLVSLASLHSRGPLVVSFNRGAWCSYCGLQLRALARAYPDIVAAGGAVVSIVPETEEFARKLVELRGLPFTVLIDLDLGYALSLGLVFWIGEELREVYLKLGIDFARSQRNDGWFLPIPATFVVGQDGRVLARYLDPDFRHRMPIGDIMGALAEATAG